MLHAELAPEKHWFLQLLGVAPEHQGKGHASRLLRPMLERLDEEGLPAYLETTNPVNVPRYEHFGFEVVREGMMPGTPIRFWCMLRDPC